MTLDELQRRFVLRILKKHNGHRGLAAEELGISLKTIYNKLRKWRMPTKRDRIGEIQQ